MVHGLGLQMDRLCEIIAQRIIAVIDNQRDPETIRKVVLASIRDEPAKGKRVPAPPPDLDSAPELLLDTLELADRSSSTWTEVEFHLKDAKRQLTAMRTLITEFNLPRQGYQPKNTGAREA